MLALDNSMLASVAKCSTQFAMRYVHGFTTPDGRAELKCGTAVHEGLAVYFKGGSVADALLAFDKSYKEFSDRVVAPRLTALDATPREKSMGRFLWANVRTILREWFAQHPLSALPFTVHENWVEKQFRLQLFPDLELWGTMDILARRKVDGKLAPVDNKTTKNVTPWYLAKYDLASQGTHYGWAAEQLFGQPVSDFGINALGIDVLPTSDKKCSRPEHKGMTYKDCGALHTTFAVQFFPRRPDQQDDWKLGVKALAERAKRAYDTPLEKIETLPNEGIFVDACGFCDFREWCLMGRVADDARRMFAVEFWGPKERT